jgi:two-component system sensor histidine kinase BaeS
VLSGNSLSASRSVGGKRVYIEARPAGGGGVVLLQTRTDATASGEAAIRRTLLAILIGVGIAGVVGVLLAVRLARPLRTAAAAAHALAAGRRDVVVPPSGPAEVAEVAEAVNLLAGALAHSEARQRDFLMSVSHDLRTPLTAITGYAESLAEGVVPSEATAEAGRVMLGEARRLERLVGDLLDLARLDAQNFRLEFGPVDLADLARAAARVWDSRCRAVGVRFVLQSAPAWAWTDAARLRQVLDGLMENALRVTPGGAPIVLAVRTDPDGWACVEIRDGGPGLSDDDIAVAFQRSALYQRYRGVRQVGTGLGLAIVYGLVTRLGGTIEAGHAQEGGARFSVRLPPMRA